MNRMCSSTQRNTYEHIRYFKIYPKKWKLFQYISVYDLLNQNILILSIYTIHLQFLFFLFTSSAVVPNSLSLYTTQSSNGNNNNNTSCIAFTSEWLSCPTRRQESRLPKILEEKTWWGEAKCHFVGSPHVAVMEHFALTNFGERCR